MIQNNMTNQEKRNYKTTIYQDRYILHPETHSFCGWEVNCCSSNSPCSVKNVGNHPLSKKNDYIKYGYQEKLETMKFKIIGK